MFVRVKTKGPYRYLQIVENHREGKRTVQRVLATLGRADELAESGGIDVLLKYLGRFATRVRVIQDYEEGRLEAGALRHLGPDLVFGRLWKELGLDTALNHLLKDRGFEFPVERAVYLAVLHRLFESGSDRAGDRWRRDVRVDGSDGLKLHHLYRPIFHQGDATIQGHVFCSFLALVLRDELQRRLAQRGVEAEWADILRDLLALAEVEVKDGEHWYLLRTALQGVAGKICQAAGVSLPPPMRT
ncbi:MAG: hypothetical protein ACOZF2_00240 [Thermodesulfobacteriota bacterium]